MDLGWRLLVFLFTAVFEKMRRKKGEQLLSPRSRAHRSEPRTIKILRIVFFYLEIAIGWKFLLLSPHLPLWKSKMNQHHPEVTAKY